MSSVCSLSKEYTCSGLFEPEERKRIMKLKLKVRIKAFFSFLKSQIPDRQKKRKKVVAKITRGPLHHRNTTLRPYNTLIAIGSFVLGLVIFVVLAITLVRQSLGLTTLGAAMVWTTIFLVWGFRIVPTVHYIVVERLGQYYYTKENGWALLVLPGIIDRIAPDGGRGDYKYKKVDLYTSGGSKDNIDFTDGSAPIKAEIWYRINPDQKDSPALWTYVVKDSEARVREVIDSVARPKLQKISIDEAQQNLDSISEGVRNDPGVQRALKNVGAQLDPTRGFLITDVELPPGIVTMREELLVGTKEAGKQATQGLGYVRTILAIIEEAKKNSQTIGLEQAISIYQTQRALETLGKTGANITLVGENVKGVLMTMGLGGKTPTI